MVTERTRWLRMRCMEKKSKRQIKSCIRIILSTGLDWTYEFTAGEHRVGLLRSRHDCIVSMARDTKDQAFNAAADFCKQQ